MHDPSLPCVPVIVIGAGPAGLTAAHELSARGLSSVVLERTGKVGGISRTEVYKGYRFDIGGHRFFTDRREIERLWSDMLGEDFLPVRRLSRIYYQGRFIRYPLDFFNALSKVGFIEGFRMLFSYLRARVRPEEREDSFEQWIVNRFGRRLYRKFFKSYTEKVWGVPCRSIRAEWAAQRIRGLSLRSAVAGALFGTAGERSTIRDFSYPLKGPGMMWERFRDVIEARGSRVLLNAGLVRMRREGRRITRVAFRAGGGTAEREVDSVISSCPLTSLVFRLDPPPPDGVLEAARRLSYRAFILVGLIVDRAYVFPDNWIYVHEPGLRVGRVQNFKNWSAAMVPDPGKTSLGMEYFCSENDDLWSLTDRELLTLAVREAVRLRLVDSDDVEDGVVFRQPKAYPVYDDGYRAHVQTLRDYLTGLENLQTIGRNGLHRYNNQDHSMMTALMAVRNLCGERHDVWNAEAAPGGALAAPGA